MFRSEHASKTVISCTFISIIFEVSDFVSPSYHFWYYKNLCPTSPPPQIHHRAGLRIRRLDLRGSRGGKPIICWVPVRSTGFYLDDGAVTPAMVFWVVATQIFLEFSPRTLVGRWSNFWRGHIFSNGLVQPPTSFVWLVESALISFSEKDTKVRRLVVANSLNKAIEQGLMFRSTEHQHMAFALRSCVTDGTATTLEQATCPEDLETLAMTSA